MATRYQNRNHQNQSKSKRKPSLVSLNSSISNPLKSLDSGASLPNYESALPVTSLDQMVLETETEQSQPASQQNATSGSAKPGDSSRPKRGKADKYAKLEQDLTAQFGSLAMLIYAFNQPDGQVIGMRAESLAQKMTGVARVNDKFYETVRKALDGSVYTALIVECAVITQLLLANHGINPMARLKKNEEDQLSGVPDSLSA